MNKILIKDLLNNQNERNNIDTINGELFQLCSTLPNYATFVPPEISDSFARVLAKLINLQSSSNEVTTGVKTSYQICTIMEGILKHISKEKNAGSMEKPTINDSSVRFNIMTKTMMNQNKRSLQSYRGHRFSNKDNMVLEQWYREHYQKPYLTKSSLENLSQTTELSKVQIRNWVSNRRRKERTTRVSPIIMELIQDK